MHIGRLAVVAASALAALPVYLLNSEGVAPLHRQVQHSMGPLLVSHFIGDSTDDAEASHEVLEILRYVPGVVMDDRTAVVIVFRNFISEKAEKILGSPLFVLEEPQDIDSSGSAPYPTVSTISELDKGNSTIVEIFPQSDNVAKVLHELRNLDSKIMVVGVPPDHKTPQFKSLPERSRGVSRAENSFVRTLGKFHSEDECRAATNDCSGRGDCVSIAGSYRCSCKPIQKNGYTYKFGGVDCGKRDISTQFHLLAWTTLGIIFTMVFGIGMVYNLDSEPLPGILTALTK